MHNVHKQIATSESEKIAWETFLAFFTRHGQLINDKEEGLLFGFAYRISNISRHEEFAEIDITNHSTGGHVWKLRLLGMIVEMNKKLIDEVAPGETMRISIIDRSFPKTANTGELLGGSYLIYLGSGYLNFE